MFLLNPKNRVILLCLIASLFVLYFGVSKSIPQFRDVISLTKDIETSNQEYLRYEDMQQEQTEKAKAQETKNENLIVNVFKSQYPGTPVESASVDFVNEVINMVEESGNDIITISYETNKISEKNKKELPSQIQVVILKMNLDSSYESLQRFMQEYYTNKYLCSIHSMDIVPIPEDKERLSVDIVLWLYVEG